MAAGRGTIWIWALAAVLLLVSGPAGLASAQGAVEVAPIPGGRAGAGERYQVTLRPGATLWELANNYLPLLGLDEGDQKAFQLVEASFKRAFPERPPGLLQPDDSFVLEVPPGTFVTARIEQRGGTVVYTSYAGDELTYYANHPSLSYRLVRAGAPNRAEIKLTGQASSAVDLAREIYHVHPPDFIQVRMVRAALNDQASRVTVDLEHPFLDNFRNYRDQAIRVDTGEWSQKIYVFDPDDESNPFLRVEDLVGDSVDPGSFPKEFRLEYFKDGSIKRYILTEAGDLLSHLNKPDPDRWKRVLPRVESWNDGVVEPLPPFSPAVNELGSLLPGRLLVLKFEPKRPDDAFAQPTPRPSTTGSAGLGCLGTPVALLILGLGLRKGLGVGG